MRAWEETWRVIPELGGVVADEPARVVLRPAAPDMLNVERLYLAAAAPDLVRALLALEWSATDEWESTVCPSCGERALYAEHAPTCSLDAALTKAGLPPKAREAARSHAALRKAGAW